MKNFLGPDEEGPISNFDINEKKSRLHKDILKNLDDYFCGVTMIINLIASANFKKIFTSLDIPFDILKKTYQLLSKNFKLKKYGKFYLFHLVFLLIRL